MRDFPPPLPQQPDPATPEDRLSDVQWTALSPATRVLDHLVDVVILLDQVRNILQTEEASRYLWMEPDVEHAMDATDRVIRRLSI